jgi:hypothetical protein
MHIQITRVSGHIARVPDPVRATAQPNAKTAPANTGQGSPTQGFRARKNPTERSWVLV